LKRQLRRNKLKRKPLRPKRRLRLKQLKLKRKRSKLLNSKLINCKKKRKISRKTPGSKKKSRTELMLLSRRKAKSWRK